MHTKSLVMGTLTLLISFASVNAVLFTPALPSIALFFDVSEASAQYTISWFLIGYALGQLLYGPLANRFGRKKALYMGITLQIISSLVCVYSGYWHNFYLLVAARFFLSLGSGVGLKMTFTLVNEYFKPAIASQKIAILMLSFAITPALSVVLGGFLTTYFNWQSCFYAGSLYGIILLYLVSYLPETKLHLDKDALKIKQLLTNYSAQFVNKKIVVGGLLMGISTSFIYVFSALSPFIAIQLEGMPINAYGVANLIPPVGLIMGSLCAARLAQHYSFSVLISIGIGISLMACSVMTVAFFLHLSIYLWMFVSVALVYFGLCFILSNASTFALSSTEDKAYGSAVMNCINMSCATCMVFILGFFSLKACLLPLMFLGFAMTLLIIHALQETLQVSKKLTTL